MLLVRPGLYDTSIVNVSDEDRATGEIRRFFLAG